MEEEELKRIIKEALKEFLDENFEEWKYWYFISICRKEIISFMESVSKFHSAVERLNLAVAKLETWAPQCSERERIEAIQKEMNEMNEKIDKILKLLQKEE